MIILMDIIFLIQIKDSELDIWKERKWNIGGLKAGDCISALFDALKK